MRCEGTLWPPAPALAPGLCELQGRTRLLLPSLGLQQDVSSPTPAPLSRARQGKGKAKISMVFNSLPPDLTRGKEWKNEGASGFYWTKAQPGALGVGKPPVPSIFWL